MLTSSGCPHSHINVCEVYLSVLQDVGLTLCGLPLNHSVAVCVAELIKAVCCQHIRFHMRV